MFDWGQETGGFTTLNFGATSDAQQSISLAYSESSYYWVGGDHSNGGHGPDGTISTGPIAANKPYSPPAAHMRGGFRFLNLVMETEGTVEVMLPSVKFLATPNMQDPSAWKNHFYSSDDLLNRIWYGCGYTTQMCSIHSDHGRQWPAPASGWNNSAICGVGDSVLVDGAKRDRVIWPGDMGVSSLTAITTTGDLDASRNALNTLFQHQTASGTRNGLPLLVCAFCVSAYLRLCSRMPVLLFTGRMPQVCFRTLARLSPSTAAAIRTTCGRSSAPTT